MFLILLILISVTAFFLGLSLGKSVKPKIHRRATLKPEDSEDYKNFLFYDGDIQ